MRLRPAHPAEATALSELALRSKAHWGYDAEFLEACRAELTLDPDALVAQRGTVAEVDGRLVGFYTLAGEPPEGELTCLFVEPDQIGTGVGRRLWQHAVDAARALGFQRFTIESDPSAEYFYLRMGAVRTGATPSGSIPGRELPELSYQIT
ncbi:GNAT family N-acetyltransferase [Kibdelosporangium lantanae]|uniref:GNAT family N-acetyltransferase n=1 Tax=Kibdelosporangium lantanae TaxID=1497396 RepID=A0ABW3M432_9PSEU